MLLKVKNVIMISLNFVQNELREEISILSETWLSQEKLS